LWNYLFQVKTMAIRQLSIDFIPRKNLLARFEPELDLFVEEMRNSNSYRFCNNPIEYLQSDKVKQINWSIRKKIEDNEFNFNR
jgi:hypothetical protein